MRNLIIDKLADWGGNFKLCIESKQVNETFLTYTLSAFDEGALIGFKLQIPSKQNSFGDGVLFKSLGDTSDRFLKSLYNIYTLNLPKDLQFVKELFCHYTSLNDLPYKGNGERRRDAINYMKVFFQSEYEDEYAELYISIDETNKTIEFEEKAYEFRPYVAMFLTANS